MTLVAIIKSYDQYFMIGDVLLSGPEPMKVDYILGHNPEKIVFKSPNLQGGKYMQKLCVINQNLMIGWSGNEFYARKIIERLNIVCPEGVMEIYQDLNNNDILDEIIKSRKNGEESDVWILGVVSLNGREFPFKWSSKDLQTEPPSFGGDEYIIGSGSKDVMTRALAPMKDLHIIGNDPIMFAFSIVSRLINDGIQTAKSIEENYGAYYEIAGNIGGGFQKVEDYNIAIVDAFCNDRGEVIIFEQPSKFIYTNYKNEVLLVTKLDVNRVEGLIELNNYLIHSVINKFNKKGSKFKIELNPKYQLIIFNIIPLDIYKGRVNKFYIELMDTPVYKFKPPSLSINEMELNLIKIRLNKKLKRTK